MREFLFWRQEVHLFRHAWISLPVRGFLRTATFELFFKNLFLINPHKVTGSEEDSQTTEKTSTQQDLHVVKNLKEPLFGGPTNKALNLPKTVDTVKIEGHQYKKQLPELFTGLRKLKYRRTFCTKPNNNFIMTNDTQ